MCTLILDFTLLKNFVHLHDYSLGNGYHLYQSYFFLIHFLNAMDKREMARNIYLWGDE